MSGRLDSLRGRLAAVFALVGLALAAAALVAVTSFDRLVDARRQLVDRADPALAAGDRLLADLVDQETGVRGYALGRRKSFLAPYRRGLRGQAAVEAQLRALAPDLPGTRPLLGTIMDRANAWRANIAEPTIATVSATQSARGASVLAPDGKRRFDAVRRSISDLETRIIELRGRARARLDEDTTRLRLALGGGLVVVVLAGILLWLALHRWVTSPLTRLGQRADAVAAGHLQQTIDPEGLAELRQLAERFEQMRARIVSDLQEVEQSRTELRRSNEELEQFAYVASHDLQEPLRKIAGFCELLERRYGDQLDDRARQYLAFAVDGATRMQRLILDLLAFSRVGRSTENFERVALDDALDVALANLETKRAEAGAEIVRSPLPTVVGDASLLTALMQNLVGNAIKFRSEEPARIEIGCNRLRDEWLVTVADNGIGIEPEYAERVFVIFQRLHAKNEYEGTGIGLSMCKKIVEFHGGRIAVVPREGGGTLAQFTLPTIPRTVTHD